MDTLEDFPADLALPLDGPDENENLLIPPAGQETATVRRGVLVVLSAAIATLCFLQVPGRIVSDTKLDVAISPLEFLSRAWYLWDPHQAFGGVAFQAYGFFLPTGPFYVLGHSLHLPTWVIQRFWVSILLIAAFWGAVRLTEALGIGSRTSRVIAALAFTFAPPISLLGGTSEYILGFALLPWVMLPLVRASREGSTRVAAARSGIAILLIGGANGAAILAILPLPLLWFLTRTPGQRRRQLFSWWVVAVFLACAWWAVSLLLEGRYGFNLLPFTETAATTTSTTSLFDILRGNDYWVAYNQIGPTAIKSGLESVTSPLMILSGAALGGLGLFGLAHRGMKERLWLIGSLAAGVVVVGAGYPGSFGGVLASVDHHLLTTTLDLFRNVWKFQPIINLVLVLGLAHAIAVLSAPLRSVAHQAKKLRTPRMRVGMVVIPLAAISVVGLSIPFLTDKFYIPGSFKSLPTYEKAVATWLNHHAGTTTSLVVPGSPTGTYTWGSPIDEPLQWLATSDWATRGLIPDSSVGNIEMLDAVDQVLDGGVANPGLASYLAQAGVRYLVVRNDLAAGAGAPTPLQVYDVLAATPGLAPIAGFGPRHVHNFHAFHVSLPAVEIYQVGGAVHTVTSAPVANSVVVSGGANALLAMDEAGLDPGDRAVLLAGDGGVVTPDQTWVDTDSSPRVGVAYGATRGNETYVLTAGENSPVTGSPPTGSTIVPGTQHQTVAKYFGVKDVTASSFGANFLFQVPSQQPAAALDSSPDTAWVANATNNSVGQWIRIQFTKAVDLSHLGLQPVSSAEAPRVTQVAIQTARGSVRRKVDPSGGVQDLATPMGKTRWVKVTFTKVSPARKQAAFNVGAGIQQLNIPGVSAEKAEVVPADELKRFSTSTARVPLYVFTSSTPQSPFGFQYGGGDEEPRMFRVFTTPQQATYAISGTVDVRPGASLASFLKFLGPRALKSAPFHLACGQGPSLTIDNRVLDTEVTGTLGGLSGFPSLQFSVCGPSSPVTVPKGTNILVGNTGGFLKVVSVALRPALSEPYASASTARSTTITSWGQEHRTVAVGAGAATYLVVRENFNTGWTAQFKGQTLKPFEINGWQQAWVVPEGTSGTVTLTYGADRIYQIGLIVGGVLALVLLVLALWPSKRHKQTPPFTARPGPPAMVLALVATIALVILGGVLALILPLLLAVAWIVRAHRWLGVLALVAYAAAGVAVAYDIGNYPGTGIGAFGRPAQIASMVALAALFSAFIAQDKRWARKARVKKGAPNEIGQSP